MKAFLSWIAQWGRTAVKAATDVAFYRTAGDRRTGEAAGHLAMLAVLWTLPIAIMFFVGLRAVSGRLAEGLRTDIPPGTVFEMKEGRLSSNLEEPLVFREDGAVVIVNTASSTLTLREGESGIVVGPDGIEQVEGERRQVVGYGDAPDFRVGREELMESLARWAPLVLFLGSLFALVFTFLSFWAGFLLNALLHGFALWLLFKLIRRPRPWRPTFVAAAYAATASIAVAALAQFAPRMEFLPDLVYWGFIAWIAYDAYKGGAPASPKEGTHERKPEAAAERPHTEGQS